MTYCDYAASNPWDQAYHDLEYGFPIDDEAVLFERLILEIMQAGLSWLTVLKKREAFQSAFEGFVVDTVAAYDDAERERLLADASIIRNRRKIDATIENAKRFQALRDSDGGFAAWLAKHHPLSRGEWAKVFKRTFVFTGPEIVAELLFSIGYLPGAHDPACPVYAAIAKLEPPWLTAGMTP